MGRGEKMTGIDQAGTADQLLGFLHVDGTLPRHRAVRGIASAHDATRKEILERHRRVPTPPIVTGCKERSFIDADLYT